MGTTKVQDLTNVGNIADGDVLVGERVTGTTVTMTFNGVLLDSEFGSNGLMTRTGAGTYANRTIAGTSSVIDVTNGDGVSGNPTIDISSSYVGQTSITTLGTITTGTWQGTAIDLGSYATGTLAVANGGTGQTTYTDGQLLIGNSTGNTLTKATITGGTEITVTNGSGSITIDCDFTPSSTDTLTNKTIDATNNTISDLPYDIAFIAGYNSTMTKEDVSVRTYGELVMSRSGEIVGEAGYADTAPTDAALILDIEKNGTTIYTTKPQFASTSQTLTAGTLKTDGTEDFVSGDRITFKITQVGSTEPGEGIRFTVKAEV